MLKQFILLIGVLIISTVCRAAENGPHPSTEHTPQEVIDIVVDALKHNDPVTGDQGIATVYRFASPGNRENTGPIERFTEMIKRGFSDMLNHTGSEVSEIEIDGDTALQVVWLTTQAGKEVGYLFQIGKQSGGEYDGVWMTEAVIPQPERGQSI